MINLMDTYDEDGDGKFEMKELANVLKLEENFLDKIIGQESIKNKHIKVNNVNSIKRVYISRLLFYLA